MQLLHDSAVEKFQRRQPNAASISPPYAELFATTIIILAAKAFAGPNA